MSSPITQSASFSTSKVSITQPKTLDSGGKMSYLNYGEGKPLVMQTPSLPSPFGLSIFDKTSPPKYSVDLAMRGYQENPKVKQFYDACAAIDAYMVEQGVKSSKAWFGKEKSKDIIEDAYTPILKWSRDKEGNVKPYPPNIKLQLKKARGSDDFECKFYDAKSKLDPHAKPLSGIPLEEMLPKKVEATALIQCTGVWFAGGKFGLSWKALKICLDRVPTSLGDVGFSAEDGEDQQVNLDGVGFSEPREFGGSGSSHHTTAGRSATAEFAAPAKKPVIADSEDEEEEEEEIAPAPPAKTYAASVGAKPVVEDSDEDDDAEVAPPPVPAKKTVVTKKKVVAATKK